VKNQKLSDQVRDAIDDFGLTRSRIAKKTQIDGNALAKFYNGHQGLSLKALGRLGENLGLEIITRSDSKKRGSK
jgi:hypothetical protein